MKISKLFHWLYALLMFLPLVMFLPSCLYYSLNKYATNETTTTINYKYESNEVNSLADLVVGNIYFCDDLYLESYYGTHSFGITIYQLSSSNLSDFSPEDYDFSHFDTKKSNLYLNYNGDYIDWFQINNDGSFFFYTLNDINDYHFYNAIFSITNGLNGFIEYCNSYGFNASNFSYTDYNVIESVETNVQDTISNKLYNAWESIWNLPLFAWTQNSFISAPFTYITGLFGLQATNSLNYVFTYFCSISICWLVFDLLMYVPNLAHRWLDKGAIE